MSDHTIVIIQVVKMFFVQDFPGGTMDKNLPDSACIQIPGM